ncbi:L-histidine N(alpha)-methyltransferase [Marinobacter nanhaiticus D15-8W]|uniref:L-histidine N(Alpha)-methyltransferase n=1 Tax=Marinobacter nanhaiticus D15-8W TaxID=626887 RepID=N6WPG3_9GAMM|nr:L-histidine N(alpha)-methyltransferase [Marinobacter nanhaiticus]ENO12962.1 L-histidine N(alpha)-methyltransferase [Marinobacter nanhaiticus D15-8W]
MAESAKALNNRLDFTDMHPAQQDVVAEVLDGLNQPQKTLSPKFFYDERGSQLFESITEQPEYYPTRAERMVLRNKAPDIARHVGEGAMLIEPGCGSCEKVRLLLDALQPSRYVAMDISSEFLLTAANTVAGDFPELDIQAVCADFSQLDDLELEASPARRVAFFPGSTLGNFTPEMARNFLRSVRHMVGDDGGLLIGVDRHKDADTLTAAYNDQAGVTAAFNLNALTHLNRILPADFDTEAFRHRAFYNTDARRVEMHLESLRDQSVQCAGQRVGFRVGETIHSENSYKYTDDDFSALARDTGFAVEADWSDAQSLFSVFYCRAN